jgi:hypothetical protein
MDTDENPMAERNPNRLTSLDLLERAMWFDRVKSDISGV